MRDWRLFTHCSCYFFVRRIRIFIIEVSNYATRNAKVFRKLFWQIFISSFPWMWYNSREHTKPLRKTFWVKKPQILLFFRGIIFQMHFNNHAETWHSMSHIENKTHSFPNIFSLNSLTLSTLILPSHLTNLDVNESRSRVSEFSEA